MTFGEAVCCKRKAIGLSQEELANKLGVARQTISPWKRDIFLPDGTSLIALSKIFNCSIDDLVGNANPPQPPAAEPEEPGAEAECKTA